MLKALFLLLFSLSAPGASAHTVSAGFSSVEIKGRTLDYSALIPVRFITTVPEFAKFSGAEFEAHAPEITRYFATHFLLWAQDSEEGKTAEASCVVLPGGRVEFLGVTENLKVTLTYQCPGTSALSSLRVKYLLFSQGGMDPRNVVNGVESTFTHLFRISGGELGAEVKERAFSQQDSETVLPLKEPEFFQTVTTFLKLGIHHILTGYDHLMFLFGLLLVAMSLKSIVKIVTSFTIAHSITLILATLKIVQLPSRFIEPAIALSIAYIAVENLLSTKGLMDTSKRWRISFLFGLIHGFGFASALQEMELPRSALVASLLTFNLGVEIGQLSIVALLYPLLLRMHRASWNQGERVGRVFSAAIFAGGMTWAIQRIGFPDSSGDWQGLLAAGLTVVLGLVFTTFSLRQAQALERQSTL